MRTVARLYKARIPVNEMTVRELDALEQYYVGDYRKLFAFGSAKARENGEHWLTLIYAEKYKRSQKETGT